MQIGFFIWNKISDHKIKNEIYIFFFSACFLINIKAYFPEKKNFFINWLNEHEIPLKFVKWAEKIIKNNMNNNTNLNSSEIVKLLNQINNNIQFSPELKDLILFSLCEYNIYGKFNKFTIILACSIINIYYSQNKSDEEKISIKNDLINFFKNYNIINLNDLENCINEIIKLLNKEENYDSDDDEYLNNCLTTSSSHSSLNQIFSGYDENFEDNFNADVKKFENKNINIKKEN